MVNLATATMWKLHLIYHMNNEAPKPLPLYLTARTIPASLSDHQSKAQILS